MELRNHQIFNAFFLLFLAQGTPCMLAGDEFGNSQKGNNNVYCQDNPIGWTDWRGLEKKKELHDFVKELIAFRKSHPILTPERELQGIDLSCCGVPDVSYHGEEAWQIPGEVSSRQLGVYYSGGTDKKRGRYVAYNSIGWNSICTAGFTKGIWLVCESDDGTGDVRCAGAFERSEKIRVKRAVGYGAYSRTDCGG